MARSFSPRVSVQVQEQQFTAVSMASWTQRTAKPWKGDQRRSWRVGSRGHKEGGVEGTLRKGVDPHGRTPRSNGLGEAAAEAEGDLCLTSFSRPVQSCG